MSTPKGYSSQEKDDRLTAQFSTVEPVRDLQNGLSVLAHQFVTQVGSNAAQAGSTSSRIIAAGHSARKGDIIQFTSGTFLNREVKVWSVGSGTIDLAETLPSAVPVGSTFQILRHKYPLVDNAGSVSITGSISFAEEATAADGGALPALIKVVGGFDGSAVQVLSTDASGELQIDVVSSALPSGAATESTLSALSGKVPANLTVSSTRLLVDGSGVTQPVSGTVGVSGSVAVTGPLTNAELRASAVPVSAASLPLPAGAATSAVQTDGTQKTQLVDAAGDIADVKLLSVNLASTDKGLVTNTIIHGETTGGGGGYVDVKVTPSGALTVESTLSSLDAAVLGQDTMANSLPVVIASDQSTVPVSAASLPLPSGAATETTLSGINTKIPANLTVSSTRLLVDGSGVTQPVSGSVSVSGSVAVTGPLTNTELRATAVPVSAASLPLPSDASTETTLSALNGKVPANLTVSSTRLLVDGSGVTQPISATSLPLPFGAASETTLSSINSKTPALGQALMVASQPVVIASNQSNVPVSFGGKSVVARARNVYSSTNVTTATYVQLVASLAAAVNEVEIFDSSGQTLVLATGGAGSETDQAFVFPGGNGRIPLTIASGTRVSIKAVSATANDGEIAINFYS